ncbi:MAG: hypothetical protein WCJ30_21505, partial [Deltaproteobacteria bacterium]
MPSPSAMIRRRPEGVSRSTRAFTVATAGSARRASGANEMGMPSPVTIAGARTPGGGAGTAGGARARGADTGTEPADAAGAPVVPPTPPRPQPAAAIESRSTEAIAIGTPRMGCSPLHAGVGPA